MKFVLDDLNKQIDVAGAPVEKVSTGHVILRERQSEASRKAGALTVSLNKD